MKSTGKVYLVGGGPGDPGLLTRRGAELLERAEVVVYDGLVNRELLRLAPASAERIYGGKHGPPPVLSQVELSALLIRKAREGKCVVRLKGGDPYVFGRGGEEAEDLAQASIPFEVVPGVSSAEAVPNYVGIPLTHRELASSYTVVTGHEDPDKDEPRIDWAQLARTPGTLVILMGVKRLPEIVAQLVQHGRSPQTPVALVRWGTFGYQESLFGTLATISDLVAAHPFAPPAIIIIGEVVNLRQQLNWFEHRPLFGQRIVVTRARDQASELVHPLRERGADVLEIPTIRIEPVEKVTAIAAALSGLNAYDWIVFTSVNGVSAFFAAFFHMFQDMRDLGGTRLAAVGPATAARLRELHLQIDLMPEEATGKKIVEALKGYESIENLRILLPRAEAANPDLPRLLEEKGAIVDDIAFYRTVAETAATDEVTRLQETGAHWITFTSGSTVEQFHQRFDLPALRKRFPQMRFASIGPETSKAVRALGCKVSAEANPHTIDGLVAALEKADPHGGAKRGET